MNKVNINFVDNGLDDEILKSLSAEDVSEELIKAMNKQGLVQKEVQVKGKNGQTFTRKQWVKASDAKNTSKQATQTASTSGGGSYSPKNFGFRAGGQKTADFFNELDNKIGVKGHTNGQVGFGKVIFNNGESADYGLTKDGKPYVTWQGQTFDSIQKLKDKWEGKKSSNTATDSKITKDSQSHIHDSPLGTMLNREDAKKKTQSFTSKVGKTDKERIAFMDKARAQGITWKEKNDNGTEVSVAINWMRMCMAMNGHFAKGGSFDDKNTSNVSQGFNTNQSINNLLFDLLGGWNKNFYSKNKTDGIVDSSRKVHFDSKDYGDGYISHKIPLSNTIKAKNLIRSNDNFEVHTDNKGYFEGTVKINGVSHSFSIKGKDLLVSEAKKSD